MADAAPHALTTPTLAALLLAVACACFALSALLGFHRWRRLRDDLAAARREARSDPLTGRPNRRALDEALAALPDGHALLFADLDHFKAVNDAQGRAGGDAMLSLLAAAWPHGAFIARLGGDEFVALAPVLKADGLARAMLDATRAGSGGAVTLSIGLATGDPATLLLRAERALRQAKARGGDMTVRDRPQLAAVRRDAA